MDGEAGICGLNEAYGMTLQGKPRTKMRWLNKKWRGWDLNPEPMAYESTAPPLSYLATMPKDINRNRSKSQPILRSRSSITREQKPFGQQNHS